MSPRERENGAEDEPIKPYQQILTQKIAQGLTELQRPSSGLFISGFSAGLDIGFSVFLMGIVFTLLNTLVALPVVQILMAGVYPVGFIFVIFGRSELFTEHTTLAIFPVFDGRASVSSLLRLWIIIYFSNLIGAATFSVFLIIIGSALGIINQDVYLLLANQFVLRSWEVIILSGIFAGWLMGLVTWLVTAGKETISQIFFVWLITFAIGLGKLHHCILGTVEILPSIYLGLGISFLSYLATLLWTTIGNILGGIVFVAIIKYSHVIRREGKV
jgi:formate/nitrite transporter FocA (FNT family)